MTLKYDDGTYNYAVTYGEHGAWWEAAVLFEMPHQGKATAVSVRYISYVSNEFHFQFYSAVVNPNPGGPMFIPGTPISDQLSFTSSLYTSSADWTTIPADVELGHGPFFLVFTYPYVFDAGNTLHIALGFWDDYDIENKRYLYRTALNQQWMYSYSKWIFRVDVTDPIRWSPVSMMPLAHTQLKNALIVWNDLSMQLPQEPIEEMVMLIERIQTHMQHASGLTNAMYALGQLAHAQAAMDELSTLIG
ncbi:hypothetical protein EF808_05525 [archaeon]|jgi:hypothetical protein|nr:MAG: hypothetical protein EF808_05525 [archaeon]